jgi:hypothetical protein
LKPEFKKKQKELKQYSAIKKQLMAADSVEECKSLLSKSTFDYRQFVKLNLQLAEYDPKKEVEKYIIEKKSYKQSSKLYGVIPLMRKKWEWITTSSFDDLIQLLQDPQLENLIISEHGASNGYIMDLKEHQMPLELLKAKLSPRLQTLAFFSCHGDKIKDLYKIQENLLKQESVHALRKVLWLPATEVVPGFSKEGEVVVQLLGPFIKKVDHAIRKLEKGNQRAQVLAGYQFKKDSLDSSRCQIMFSHLEKNQPWFAVKLNEALISVWEPSGVAKPLSFSCKELVEGKNTLRIYNITMDFEKVGLLSTLATATNESAFQIQGLSTTQRIDQVRWMPKKVEADGKMQGLVLEFNLINSQIP